MIVVVVAANTGTLDGGDGTDSLSLADATATLITAGFDYVSNSERLTKPLIRIKGKEKDLHPIINFSNSAKESENVLKLSPKSFNANSNSINQVVDFIRSEYNDWIEGRYKKQTLPNIDSLSRESLTNKLFDIITGIK